MGKGGKYIRKREKWKSKPVLLILGVLILALVIGGGVFYKYALGHIRRAEITEQDVTITPELELMMGGTEPTLPPEITQPTTEEATQSTTVPATPLEPDALNVLVVGQAARDGEDYHMADTMILVTVNKNTKVVTLTSFYRDTYVDLPDYKGHPCGWQRLNMCYHLGWTFAGNGGAMEMTNICLKNNFGVEVDHNVEIDFQAFTKIIDILGGIRMPLTQAELDYMAKEGFENLAAGEAEGEYRLFGEEALCFARMRKAEGDSDSDIVRTARQRNLMEAILKKLIRKGPEVVTQLVREILPMVVTNMTDAQITQCLVELLPMLPQITIEKGICPVEGSSWGEVIDLYGTPSSVLFFDQAWNKRVMIPLTEGHETVRE